MKKDKIVIDGKDVLKAARQPYKPSFKSGMYLSEKDRPRKRYKPKDYRKEDY